MTRRTALRGGASVLAALERHDAPVGARGVRARRQHRRSA
jgi:hypothetical protein